MVVLFVSGCQSQSENQVTGRYSTAVTIAGQDLMVALADTDETRVIGLAETKEMAENQGMLFVFSSPGVQRFWMKNMYIPIDIIWLDQAYQVLGCESKVQPPVDPLINDNKLEVYESSSQTQYVLEVRAGFCEDFVVDTADYLEF